MSVDRNRRHLRSGQPLCTARACGGYSLLELAIVLAIIGAIGLVLWKLTPRFMSLPAIARLTAPPLAAAEDALNGFVLAQGRLPCPDTDGGGIENCGPGGAGTGWLPTRTLGLYLQPKIRYGVYRAPSADVTADADLATLRDRYRPLLPPDASSALDNGLDFCAALLSVMRAPGTALTAGAQRLPIAYGLALSGNVAGGANQFAGLNAVADQFELGGAARNLDYQDQTRTMSAGELFGKLGCVRQLAAVNGGARAAFAAYDSARVAGMVEDFRDFALGVRKMNRDQAIVGVALATADEADALATSATAIALTAASAGSMAGTIAAAAISIGLASASLAAAVASVVLAEQAVAKAEAQLAAASLFKLDAAAMPLQRSSARKILDRQGLLP